MCMLQHFNAVDVWHFNVRDDYIVTGSFHFADRQLSRVDSLHLVPFFAQSYFKQLSDRALIVAHQHISH